MTYLLDTDMCIAWLRGMPGIRQQMLTKGPEEVGISVVTHAELLYGAMRSSRVTENLAKVKSFVRLRRVIDLSEPVLVRFAVEKARLRGERHLVPDFDILIAATALAHGLVLVTGNLRHYERFPGLRTENWLDR